VFRGGDVELSNDGMVLSYWICGRGGPVHRLEVVEREVGRDGWGGAYVNMDAKCEHRLIDARVFDSMRMGKFIYRNWRLLCLTSRCYGKSPIALWSVRSSTFFFPTKSSTQSP